MLRSWLTSIGTVVLLCVEVAGVAPAYTSPCGSPPSSPAAEQTAKRLDEAELVKLLRERDPHLGINRIKLKDDSDLYVYTLLLTVKEQTHRVMVLSLPAKKQIQIWVPLSSPLSAEQETAVREHIKAANGQIAPCKLEVDAEEHILFATYSMEAALTRPMFEANLNQLLESVVQTKALWADLQ